MVRGLRHNFEFEGYQVCVARDGEAAINETLHNNPDIILLDVMLPKLSGLDVCRHLRAKGVTTPIIMLTARGQETDKVVGLEVGADDYVTDRKSTRLNSSHGYISYAVFCLKKKNNNIRL